MVDTRYLYTIKATVRKFLFFTKTYYGALAESPRKAFDSLMEKMPESVKKRATYNAGLLRKPDYPGQRVSLQSVQWWRTMSYDTITEKYKDWE